MAEGEPEEKNLEEEEPDDVEDGEGENKDKKKKKKKKPLKPEDKDAEGAAVEGDGADEGLSSQEQLMQILRRTRVCEDSRRHVERPHPFWDTQPVPAVGSEYSQDSGPIDEAHTRRRSETTLTPCLASSSGAHATSTTTVRRMRSTLS